MSSVDYLKTQRYYGDIKPGTLVRNDGYGSRLMRVVEVVKDSVLLESYGLLHKGNITFAKTPRRITGKIHEWRWGRKPGFFIGADSRRVGRRHVAGGSYTPVTLVSKFYDPLDAFRMGFQYAKSRQKSHAGCSRVGQWNDELQQVVYRPTLEYLKDLKPFENPFEGWSLEQAFADGYSNYWENPHGNP